MIILTILVVLLMGSVTFLSNMYEKEKNERKRIESNFYNVNQELDSLVDTNGTLHYTVETLNLTKKELEKTHSNLVDEAENMKLKIKNLESLGKIDIGYQVKDSLIPTKMVNDTTFISERKDDWVIANWNSTLIKNGSELKVTNYNMVLKDSIIIPTEFTTKGWWIFKKVTGVKIHVKSLNPYSKVNKIEYVRFKK